MFRVFLVILVVLSTPAAIAGDEQKKTVDLFFSEGLYYAYQGRYFDAISRIDSELAQYYGLDEPELNSLHLHIGDAEFSIGDFELYYRMHNRAGRAIKAVIEGDVPDPVRNDAAYRLAKIFQQKQQHVNALHTIERIKGEVPEKIINDVELLRAQIYISNGRFGDAVETLRKIEGAKGVAGFAGYNLAIALIGNGKIDEGLAQLEKVGQISSSDKTIQAIRDKANLILGFKLMENKQPEKAKIYFERIRLQGPFSNRALLGSGWADVASGKYKRAIVPWSMLADRNITDQSVQEVMLGLPFAYGKLNAHGKAAVLYGKALDTFSNELDKLDSSIKSIREGKFLEAVVREELKQDKNWLINLRSLPDTPETHYLMELLASNDFQESLKNYFDLVELGKKLSSWDGYLEAFTDIINIRKEYYTPLFPVIQEQFRKLDAKMKLRVEQREKIASRLDKMLIAPRPDYLATVNERLALQRITEAEKRLAKKGQMNPYVKARIDRLKGVISWKIDTEYNDRFTTAHNNLATLDEHINKLKKDYRSFVRTRQAATQSYMGYDDTIRQLHIRMRMADDKIKVLKARQGHMLETMAIEELQKRRKKIEELQIKARFAMAESYDRAVKAQQEKTEKELLEKQKQKEKLEKEKQDKEQKHEQEQKQEQNTEVKTQ